MRSRDPRIVPAGFDRLFGIKPVNTDWAYTYGWYAYDAGDQKVFEHSGFTPGFLALATIAPAANQVVVVLTNMSGLAHGDLPRAVTHAALGWDPVPVAASFFSRLAIWSAVAAPLGLMIWIYKTSVRLFARSQPLRPWARGLNVLAAAGLLAGSYAVFIGFQAATGVSFATGWTYYPDLTLTAVTVMALALLLAAGRLALAIRGG